MKLPLQALLLLASASTAHASGVRAALHVEPGATCLRADTLAPQIEAWLDKAVEAGWTIEVRGGDDPRTVRFVVRDRDRVVAERAFEPGPSACMQLESTLALAIALALKVSLLEELAPRAAERWSAVGVAGTALLGFTPHTPVGAQLTADTALDPRWFVRGALGFAASAGNRLPQTGASFDLRVLWLRLEGCAAAYRRIAWTLETCVGARVGSLWADAAGLASSAAAREPWLALQASTGVSLAITRRWSVDIAGALLASLVRASFDVRTRAGARVDEFAVPAVAGELSAGPRLRF